MEPVSPARTRSRRKRLGFLGASLAESARIYDRYAFFFFLTETWNSPLRRRYRTVYQLPEYYSVLVCDFPGSAGDLNSERTAGYDQPGGLTRLLIPTIPICCLTLVQVKFNLGPVYVSR